MFEIQVFIRYTNPLLLTITACVYNRSTGTKIARKELTRFLWLKCNSSHRVPRDGAAIGNSMEEDRTMDIAQRRRTAPAARS